MTPTQIRPKLLLGLAAACAVPQSDKSNARRMGRPFGHVYTRECCI